MLSHQRTEKDGVEDENNDNVDSSPKLKKHDLVDGPKRKAAMLIAYCGENYHGMAMNRGDRQFKTIEGELVSALVKARLVPENCWEDPNKMTYKIASRTDKGVSTCGQVASLKLIMNEKAVDLLNENLPPDIQVLAVKRATKGFSAHQCAGSRTYSYTLPTFAFANPSDVCKEYRIPKAKLEHIQSILEKYKGTHSYHNFTSGKRMGEMSAQRYIMDFYYESPHMQEDMEFMTFKLKGQSFMIHQIRKMIGLMIVLVSGYAKEDYFQKAFSQPLVDIPKAPGTGLVLERVHFDGYNMKHGHLHGGIEFTDLEDQIEEFRKKRILPSIYRKEKEDSSMLEWLNTLLCHDFTGERAKEDWEKQNALRKAAKEEVNGKREEQTKEVVMNKTLSHSEDTTMKDETDKLLKELDKDSTKPLSESPEKRVKTKKTEDTNLKEKTDELLNEKESTKPLSEPPEKRVKTEVTKDNYMNKTFDELFDELDKVPTKPLSELPDKRVKSEETEDTNLKEKTYKLPNDLHNKSIDELFDELDKVPTNQLS